MAIDREQVGLIFKLQADSKLAQTELTKFKQFVSASVNDVKSSFSSLSPTLAGLETGIGGVGVAAAALGAGLVKLALQTADYAGNLSDLSAKTNLNTDTLQTLRLAATLTGQSLEQISNTAVIFQRNLDKARGGNEKLQATFKALQIDLNGPVDEGFRKTLEKLSRMEDGSRKTAIALDIFGRSGAALLPILSQVGGDFGKLEERARELGIVLSKDDVEAADKFGDQLDLLKLQAEGLAHSIGAKLIPVLSGLAGTLRSLLREPKGFLTDLLKDLQNSPTGVLIPFNLAARVGQDQALDQALADAVKKAGETPPTFKPTRGGGRRTKDGRPTEFDDLDALELRAEEKFRREQLEREIEAFEVQEEAEKDHRRRLEEIARISDERLIDRVRFAAEQRLITEEEAARKIEAVRQAAFDRREAQIREELKVTREQLEANAQDTENNPAIVEGIRQELLAVEQKFVDELNVLLSERAQAEEDATRRIEAARQRDLENLTEKANQIKKLYQEIRDAQIQRERGDSFSSRSIFGDAFADTLRRTGSEMQSFQSMFAAFQADIQRRLAELPSFADTAFNSFVEGLENMTEAFARTGQTGPAAMRQLAAGVIQALAQLAGKKGVYELAEGLAALARGIFGDPRGFPEAAKHFAASAVYFSLAAAGGAASRAVAPGGVGGGGFQGGQPINTNQRTLSQDSLARRDRVIVIHVETDGGAIVRKVAEDYSGNGVLRKAVRRDVLGESAG